MRIMKKAFIVALLALSNLAYLSADLIPTGCHNVLRTVTVANCSAFPDYTLVGYIYLIQSGGHKVIQIQENVPIDKGYKLNTLKVYALKTSFVSASGGLSAINFDEMATIIEPSAFLNPAPTYVVDADPLKSEKFVYKIAGVTAGKLVLYVAEHTMEYNNGQAPVTEYFQPPVN